MLKETNIINSICHCEEYSATKQSHQIATPCGLAITEQSGRSMVEMLGVLAVIGVLSVAGIAGYSNAMNKHRANELLYQVSMRTTSCMTQIAQGRTTLSLVEFGDYNGYSFGATYDTSNKKYTITITPPTGESISQAVCDNMKNAVPSTVTFTPTSCAATNSSIALTYSDGTGTNEVVDACGGTCGENEYCNAGTCEETWVGKSCNFWEGPSCGGDAPWCNHTTGKCSESAEGAMCDNNTDCNGGYCISWTCHGTAEGVSCTQGEDCAGTDAPICNEETWICEKES